MSGDDPVELPRTCPRCGSTAVARIFVLEHKSCGAIKPDSAFLDDGGLTCPDCDAECDDVEYVTKGAPFTCKDCGYNSSGSHASQLTHDDGKQTQPAVGLEKVRERIAAVESTPSRPSWTQLAQLIVLVFVIFSSGMGGVGAASLLTEQTASETSTWNEYQTIVIFRDDDIQPRYRTAEMRAVDRVFIQKDVPVTKGVIPAIDGEELAPNQDLCQYLRTQSRDHPDTFEYALHGYSHEQRSEFHGGSEFGGITPSKQRELIQNGTRALGDCVRQTPTTFIPPLDTYDNATARALAAENYTVVSGGGWFTDDYYNETSPFEAHGVLHLPNSQSLANNWTTNEFYDQAYLERQFDRAYQDGAVYVQMLHSPSVTTESKLDTLRGLIDHMKSKEDVAFMTVGEFAQKRQTGRLERTDTGWRVKETPDNQRDNRAQQAVDIGRDVWERIASYPQVGGYV